MTNTDQRLAHYAFTHNNYTDKEEKYWQGEFDCVYLIYSNEIAPSTGTPHLQGYFVLANPRTLKSLNKEFNNRCHFEITYGSPQANYNYVRGLEQDHQVNPKPPNEHWFEKGIFPVGRGHRTDLDVVRSLVAQQAPMHKIGDRVGYQAFKHAEMLYRYAKPEKMDDRQVIWIHGPSGSGKTHRAIEIAEERGLTFDIVHYVHPHIIGFEGSQTAIFDDFDINEMPFKYMLRLFDKYPLTVKVMGTTRPWNPKLIIITDCSPPTHHTSDVQVLRRITEILEIHPRCETIVDTIQASGK